MSPDLRRGRSFRVFPTRPAAHYALSQPGVVAHFGHFAERAAHYALSQPGVVAHFGHFAERAAQYAVSAPPAAGMGRRERFPRGKEAANRSSRRFPAGWPRIPPDLCLGWRGFRVVSGRRGARPFKSALLCRGDRACRAIRAAAVHVGESPPCPSAHVARSLPGA